MTWPGNCPECGHALRVLPIPGDTATGRRRAYVVACSDNPNGCPHPSETVGANVKRRLDANIASRYTGHAARRVDPEVGGLRAELGAHQPADEASAPLERWVRDSNEMGEFWYREVV